MKNLLFIPTLFLALVNYSCYHSSNNSVEDKLSVDVIHPTSGDKQLFFKYKQLFEEQMYDSNSCYMLKGVISACPPIENNKSCRQIIEAKVDNIFMNYTKDSIAVLVVFRHAWILEDGSLEDEITECSLMKAIVHENNQLEFVCFPNNVWIYADGNQVEPLLKKFKHLMINGGGYYIGKKKNEKFIYQLFNEPDSVLGNI